MIKPFRPAVVLLLACLLVSLLPGQERPIKWSPWRAIDEHFSTVRIRTSYDNNEGRGWVDGRHHWLFEVKNISTKSTMKVGLGFAQWNMRTRMWDPPAEGLPTPFELEPGEVHEGTAVGGDKDGFEFRYAIGIVGEDGKAKRIVSGLTNSRVVTNPIKESSLVANAAFAKAMAPEKQIAAGSEAAAPAAAVEAPPPAPATKFAKASPAGPKAAPAAANPPSNLPMTAPTLPPASVEGLDAAGKFALWSQRAQQGEAEAMFELGRACRFGDGTAKDNTAATEWYRQAAIRGHAGAMTKLGYAYDSGLGTERNEAAALEWWRKAATLGDTEATRKLARLGVPVTP